MASPSRLSLYFSFLFLLLVAIAMVASAARYAPANPIASKERNEGMIGLQDYGDARANHRHDPHRPLTVKGNNKELDG